VNVAEPDFRFIGERLDRLQAEMRDMRAEMRELRTLKTEVPDLVARVEEGFAAVDRRFTVVDLELKQIHQTMATNLAIVLEAIKGLRSG
jgi:hypothetical protein